MGPKDDLDLEGVPGESDPEPKDPSEGEEDGGDGGGGDDEAVREAARAKKDEEKWAALNEKLDRSEKEKKDLMEEVKASKERAERLIEAAVGDKDTLEERKYEAKRKKAEAQLYRIAPHLKPGAQEGGGEGGLASGDPEKLTFTERRFINEAQTTTIKRAKDGGFSTDVAARAIGSLGDTLIHSHEPWYNRFYRNGDMSVIDEVHKFIDDKVLKPRDDYIRQKTINELKKLKLLTGPVPAKVGGTNQKKGAKRPQKRKSSPESVDKPKFDAKNPEHRQKLFASKFAEIVSGDEDEYQEASV